MLNFTLIIAHGRKKMRQGRIRILVQLNHFKIPSFVFSFACIFILVMLLASTNWGKNKNGVELDYKVP